jgi:hypothetical protein
VPGLQIVILPAIKPQEPMPMIEVTPVSEAEPAPVPSDVEVE